MGIKRLLIAPKWDRFIYIILFVIAFGTLIYFRAENLRESPGWYSDEGNFIDVAENWMLGKWQNYDVIGAPYIQRPPVHMYALASAMNVFGVDIIVSRGLSVIANIICALLIGWIAWRHLGPQAGVLAVWVIGTTPWIVAYGRLGLTYNLMAPFFLFSLICLYKYCNKPSPGWLVAAGVNAALAFTTDYLGIVCGITIGLVLIVKHPRSIVWFALIFLVTVTIVLLPILLIDAHSFFTDMNIQLLMRNMGSSFQLSLIKILLNLNELLRSESWILVGIIGLFLIKDNLFRNILLIAVGLTLILVTRIITPVGVGLHYLLHLFPLFALGLATFLLKSYDYIKNIFTGQLSPINSRFPRVATFLSMLTSSGIVFNSLVWMFLVAFSMTHYGTNLLFIDPNNLYLADPQAAGRVRAYVNANITSNDLVIGSPVLVWGLSTMHRADFMTVLANTKERQQNYLNVDDSRFVFNHSIENVKYVILDPLAEEFAPKVLSGMDNILIEIYTWPEVYEAGEIKVYLNPDHY